MRKIIIAGAVLLSIQFCFGQKDNEVNCLADAFNQATAIEHKGLKFDIENMSAVEYLNGLSTIGSTFVFSDLNGKPVEVFHCDVTLNTKNDLSIYPNPLTDFLTIYDGDVKVFLGGIDLPSGIYLFRIISNFEVIEMKKVVVK